MKNRLIGVVIAAVVLLVLFTACDDVQIVALERAEPVDYVAAIYVDNVSVMAPSGEDVKVYWGAGKNAVKYDVYLQEQYQEGMDMMLLGSVSLPDYYYKFSITKQGVKYRFGVVAHDYDSNHATSDIRWSNYIDW